MIKKQSLGYRNLEDRKFQRRAEKPPRLRDNRDEFLINNFRDLNATGV